MKVRAVFVNLILSVLQAGVVMAEAPGVSPDPKVAHITALNELKRTNPVEHDKIFKLTLVGAKTLLARLGYDVGPFDLAYDKRVISAIKAYEKNRGIPETGDPQSFETEQQMRKDRNTLDTQITVGASNFFLDIFWDTSFSINGTWTIVGEPPKDPSETKTTRILCDRERMLCSLATAAKTSTGRASGMSVDLEMVDVERWDAFEIVTKPQDGLCQRDVYRINRTQRSVTGTRSRIGSGSGCETAGNRELSLKLVSGEEIFDPLSEALIKEQEALVQWSSDATALFDELKKKWGRRDSRRGK